jgi:8-hydroxy-5-deazaflavin:NADPH oxidoreductase
VHVGILGGTGPAGRGLASRLALAGVRVTLGSRAEERAREAAKEIVATWSTRVLPIDGAANEGAAAAEMVVVGTPWDGAVSTVEALRGPLEGKVVVSMANALQRVGRELQPLALPRGSMAATIQASLPHSTVTAAFHHLPADTMANLDAGLASDVLVCGDDHDAKAATMALVDCMEGLRALDAGRLTNAGTIEAFTAVCIALNIRYKAHSYLRMGGI